MLRVIHSLSRLERHRFKASSHPSPAFSQRSDTRPHVLALMILSTLLSFLMEFARLSVRASLGKNRPEYGSRRSSTTLSLSFAVSTSFSARSGSLGSSATPAQKFKTSDRFCQEGNRTLFLNFSQALKSGLLGVVCV